MASRCAAIPACSVERSAVRLVALPLMALALLSGGPAQAGIIDYAKQAKQFRDNFDESTGNFRKIGGDINGIMDQVSELADQLPDPKKKDEPDNWMWDAIKGDFRKLSTDYMARTFREYAEEIQNQQIENLNLSDERSYPKISLNDLANCSKRS